MLGEFDLAKTITGARLARCGNTAAAVPANRKRSTASARLAKLSRMPDGLSISDALRLKHQINQSITHDGLDAREIEKLRGMNTARWTHVRDLYRKWHVPYWSVFARPVTGKVPVWGWLAVATGILIGSSVEGAWRLAGWGLTLYAVFALARAEAHHEGYREGYEQGRDDTVVEMLGLSDEDAREMIERAHEMEIDEMVISRTDDREEAVTNVDRP
jgi:hypothetical protein